MATQKINLLITANVTMPVNFEIDGVPITAKNLTKVRAHLLTCISDYTEGDDDERLLFTQLKKNLKITVA